MKMRENKGDKRNNRIIRLRSVMDKTGLSKSSIYRLSNDKDSDFPQSIKLSKQSVGWYESAIDSWIEKRKEAI